MMVESKKEGEGEGRPKANETKRTVRDAECVLPFSTF